MGADRLRQSPGAGVVVSDVVGRQPALDLPGLGVQGLHLALEVVQHPDHREDAGPRKSAFPELEKVRILLQGHRGELDQRDVGGLVGRETLEQVFDLPEPVHLVGRGGC